jgi:hypothetical protein
MHERQWSTQLGVSKVLALNCWRDLKSSGTGYGSTFSCAPWQQAVAGLPATIASGLVHFPCGALVNL